jgi:hypothetical protein
MNLGVRRDAVRFDRGAENVRFAPIHPSERLLFVRLVRAPHVIGGTVGNGALKTSVLVTSVTVLLGDDPVEGRPSGLWWVLFRMRRPAHSSQGDGAVPPEPIREGQRVLAPGPRRPKASGRGREPRPRRESVSRRRASPGRERGGARDHRGVCAEPFEREDSNIRGVPRTPSSSVTTFVPPSLRCGIVGSGPSTQRIRGNEPGGGQETGVRSEGYRSGLRRSAQPRAIAFDSRPVERTVTPAWYESCTPSEHVQSPAGSHSYLRRGRGRDGAGL